MGYLTITVETNSIINSFGWSSELQKDGILGFRIGSHKTFRECLPPISRFTCHISCVLCNLSFYFFFEQSGGASWVEGGLSTRHTPCELAPDSGTSLVSTGRRTPSWVFSRSYRWRMSISLRHSFDLLILEPFSNV